MSFSPDGKRLASGGGDTTVRFWDTSTCMPKHTGRGHKHHVLCTAWSPDGERFASADRNGEIRLWNPSSGQPVGQPLRGHKQWVNSLSWEPLHRDASGERFASGSKDGTIKVWNARTGRQLASLSGHTDSVECVKWGGEGLLYSASRDRTIKVWAMEGGDLGKLVRTLAGHGHRINTLALNVDYVCRTGPFDHTGKSFASREEMQQAALARYQEVRRSQPERLVSGSDDFTLFLWAPAESKKPLARLTGHQQPVNHLCFSPDGRHFASASFDKKVKVWNGQTGAFEATLTGHVGAVYQVCWSSDSRMVVSASKDSTVKLWELAAPKNAKATLPGHMDEVYALDWSPNGAMVASGSKDRTIKMCVWCGWRWVRAYWSLTRVCDLCGTAGSTEADLQSPMRRSDLVVAGSGLHLFQHTNKAPRIDSTRDLYHRHHLYQLILMPSMLVPASSALFPPLFAPHAAVPSHNASSRVGPRAPLPSTIQAA